ncbi:hypothetical protein [Nocardia sp. bgisy134]|uniref:hypothetical protein n=1 Tax=Nocardia sp. bgisy134 TaxID=3413789 RepID=UPI003D75E790
MTDPTDTTMDAIARAVGLGRAGDRDTARTMLTELWTELGPQGDPLHRCTLAHYLADLHDDAAQALTWDIRALDAADSLTDERVRRHHAGLNVRGFYPSLHLNLADNYRRLASFEAAERQIEAARGCLRTLGDDEYGATVRTAVEEVAQAIRDGRTEPRAPAPS